MECDTVSKHWINPKQAPVISPLSIDWSHLSVIVYCSANWVDLQFKILSTGNSDFDCKIREALLIKSEKPTLNQQLFQNGSTFILCVFK